MNLIEKIKKVTNESKGSKKAIGNFILDNQNNLNDYTVEQISLLTYTSKATVVRFAHSLGYTGWREFLRNFNIDLSYWNKVSDGVDANYPFKANDSVEKIAIQMKELHIQSIEDTVGLINYGDLKNVAKLMYDSKRIIIFAASPNDYLAKTFQRKMLSIGRHVEIAINGEMGLMAGSLTANDCSLIISYSGSKISPAVQHINLLKFSKTPVVAITSKEKSYLTERSNYVLKISSRERMYKKIENFATEVSIIYVLNLLFSLYFQIDYDANRQYRLTSSSLLEHGRENENIEQ
jgi:DNA-binding MurR/RpiR family transcriptional regulator